MTNSTVDPYKIYPPEFLAEDISGSELKVAITFGILETLHVFIFYASQIVTKQLNGPEIWIMPWACVFCLTICINAHLEDSWVGRHAVLAKPEQLVLWAKRAKITEYAYHFAVMLSKLCILCLYLRIFTTRTYRRITKGLAAVLIVFCFACVLVTSLSCRPFAYIWDNTIEGGYCIDLLAFFRSVSIPNLVTDLIILVLPLPVIWKLHVTFAQKVGLTFTFLTGSVGMIVCAVRFVKFFNSVNFADPTFNSVVATEWTIAESGTYLIAACLPSMQPLWRALCRKVIASSHFHHFKTTGNKSTWLNGSECTSRKIGTGTSFDSVSKGSSLVVLKLDALESGLADGPYTGPEPRIAMVARRSPDNLDDVEVRTSTQEHLEQSRWSRPYRIQVRSDIRVESERAADI